MRRGARRAGRQHHVADPEQVEHRRPDRGRHAERAAGGGVERPDGVGELLDAPGRHAVVAAEFVEPQDRPEVRRLGTGVEEHARVVPRGPLAQVRDGRRRARIEEPGVDHGIVGGGERHEARELDGRERRPQAGRRAAGPEQAQHEDGGERQQQEQPRVLGPEGHAHPRARGERPLPPHERERREAQDRERPAHGRGQEPPGRRLGPADGVEAERAEDREREDQEIGRPHDERRGQDGQAREGVADEGRAVDEGRRADREPREVLRPRPGPRGDERRRQREPRHDADRERELVEVRRPPEVPAQRASEEIRHQERDRRARRQRKVQHPLLAVREHGARARVLHERQELDGREQEPERHAGDPAPEEARGARRVPGAVEGPDREDRKAVNDALRIAREDRERHRERQGRDGPGAGALAQDLGQPEQHRQEDHGARVRPLEPGHEQRVELERQRADERREPADVETAEEPVHARPRDGELEHRHERQRERRRQHVRERGQGKQERGLRVREERGAAEDVRVPEGEAPGADLRGAVEDGGVEEERDVAQQRVHGHDARGLRGPGRVEDDVVGRREDLARQERPPQDEERQDQQEEDDDEVRVLPAERCEARHRTRAHCTGRGPATTTYPVARTFRPSASLRRCSNTVAAACRDRKTFRIVRQIRPGCST